jgi:hypothetical protein
MAETKVIIILSKIYIERERERQKVLVTIRLSDRSIYRKVLQLKTFSFGAECRDGNGQRDLCFVEIFWDVYIKKQMLLKADDELLIGVGVNKH